VKHPFLLSLLMIGLSACSTFKGVIHGESEDYNKLTYGAEPSPWDVRTPVETPRDRVSEQSRIPSSASSEDSVEELDPVDEPTRNRIESRRGYTNQRQPGSERLTRNDFIDQSQGDGSLWTGENDGNYFYSKTKVRARGDIVSIRAEDELIKQIGEEIKKTLSPAEQEVEMALYLKNNPAAQGDKDVEAFRKVKDENLNTAAAEDVKEKMEKAVRWSQIDLSKAISLQPNEEFRAEIIDRFQNGNYKVKTVKRVLYRGSSKSVSVVAVAPAADFDDTDSIKSGKLYEYKVRVAR
jgi:hypothetical protein